jgi:hypothetical protein
MSVVRRHPVITFFLLTYALSWTAIFWQSFFAPGVLVAALIVVLLTEGVAGLRAMGSLDLVRACTRRAVGCHVRLNRPEQRFGRTRPGHR